VRTYSAIASGLASSSRKPLTQTASYNNLNQLTNLSGQAFSFDADGNLLSDGQRNYSWDAEDRLIGISYPGQPGKQTAFAYDGLNRRTTITSTPAGGSGTTSSYIWCGGNICQARDATNATIRNYYSEGELVPGTLAQPYYYGSDQIGSVRRVFASTSSAPGYGYDPYGGALQTTVPLTDFSYAGMFYNSDSGLYLTWRRAYDPIAGRWLSRDPVGEASDSAGSLYPYANNNPVNLRDPKGLQAPEEDNELPGNLVEGIEEDLNPKLRGGLDYTPKPQVPPTPANACPMPPAGPYGPMPPAGPYSTRDTSGGFKGINTNVTADEFSGTLQSNGYTATSTTGSNGSVTVLQNGQGSTYSVYTRTSNQQSGAQYIGPSGQMLKYNLGQ
jgi:RHS repeat-associated protein